MKKHDLVWHLTPHLLLLNTWKFELAFRKLLHPEMLTKLQNVNYAKMFKKKVNVTEMLKADHTLFDSQEDQVFSVKWPC